MEIKQKPEKEGYKTAIKALHVEVCMHLIVAQSGPCDIVVSVRGLSLFNFVGFSAPFKKCRLVATAPAH